MVRDGGTENSNQIAKLCGSDPQQTQRSTSNVMRVRLVTDNSVGKGGFNITYKKGNREQQPGPDQSKPLDAQKCAFVDLSQQCWFIPMTYKA